MYIIFSKFKRFCMKINPKISLFWWWCPVGP